MCTLQQACKDVLVIKFLANIIYNNSSPNDFHQQMLKSTSSQHLYRKYSCWQFIKEKKLYNIRMEIHKWTNFKWIQSLDSEFRIKCLVQQMSICRCVNFRQFKKMKKSKRICRFLFLDSLSGPELWLVHHTSVLSQDLSPSLLIFTFSQPLFSTYIRESYRMYHERKAIMMTGFWFIFPFSYLTSIENLP